jgi:phenylalanyl-tRNA synthetase beta chain
MRTSLAPGLLEMLRRNATRQMADVRLFEMARSFTPLPGADLPREEERLAGVMWGHRQEESWLAKPEPLDLFDLKGVVETLLAGLLASDVTFRANETPAFLTTAARVFAGDRELGWLGELSPTVTDALDLAGPVFAFELKVSELLAAAEPFPLYTPLPRYPAVYLDVALVLAEGVPAARVTEVLYQHGRPWLVEARLFDVYTGPPIPAGKRSLAFRLTYRDPERTLTDEAVQQHHQRLVAALGQELGAELR